MIDYHARWAAHRRGDYACPKCGKLFDEPFTGQDHFCFIMTMKAVNLEEYTQKVKKAAKFGISAPTSAAPLTTSFD